MGSELLHGYISTPLWQHPDIPAHFLVVVVVAAITIFCEWHQLVETGSAAEL